MEGIQLTEDQLIVRKLDQINGLLEEVRHLVTGNQPTVQVPRQGPWQRWMLEALWERVEHLPGVVALFEVTAAAENQVVTFHDVLAASGLDHRQQANEHARLSRVAQELFQRKTWPIENWQDHRTGVMRYRMGGTIAEWWRGLRA